MANRRALNRNQRWLAAISAVLAPLAWSAVAPAQGRSDPAAARALFTEARQLISEKKAEQACPKFEESQRLDPGIGTLFNLADCWERIGRTASAWTRFLDVAATARSSGQADRERVARDRASKLEAKLSRLTLQVQTPAPGERVTKDGVEIGSAEWGTPVPTDPGEHVVEATAPGKKVWRTTTRLATGSAKVVVSVPPLDDEPVVETPIVAATAAPKPPETTASNVDSTFTREHPESSSGSGSTQRVVGYVIGGLGIGGLAVGTVFALQFNSKNNEALGICPQDPSNCPDPNDRARHATLVDDATKARTVSIIGFVAGGVAVATGLVLVLTAPKGTSTSEVRVVPLLGTTEGGIALAGTW